MTSIDPVQLRGEANFTQLFAELDKLESRFGKMQGALAKTADIDVKTTRALGELAALENLAVGLRTKLASPISLNFTGVPAEINRVRTLLDGLSSSVSTIFTINTGGLGTLQGQINTQIKELTSLIQQLRALNASGSPAQGGSTGGTRGSTNPYAGELKALQGDLKSNAVAAAQAETELRKLEGTIQRDIAALRGLGVLTKEQTAQLNALRATSGQVSTALNRLNDDSITKVRTGLAQARQAFDAATGAATNLAQTRAAIAAYERQIESLRGELQGLAAAGKLTQGHLGNVNRLLGQTAREMNTLNDRVNVTGLGGNIRTALTSLTEGLSIANPNVAGLTAQLGGLSAAGGPAGLVIGGLTVTVASFAVATNNATNEFAKFEQAITDVGAVSEATDKEMKGLTAQARKFSVEFGEAAVTVAGVQETLSKAGVDTDDILAGATRSVLVLSKATKVELAQAASIAAAAMNVFGYEGKELGKVADIVANGVNKSALDATGLAQSLQQVANVANDANLTLGETVAVLASFADRGLQGSDAGTSFKTMIQRLTSEISTVTPLLEKYNIEVFRAGKQRDLIDVIDDVIGAMDRMTDQDRKAFQNTVFGTDAMRAITSARATGITTLRDYITATEEQGEAERVATERMDTLMAKNKVLGESWTNLTTTYGSFFAPLKESAVEDLTVVINMIDKFLLSLQKMPKPEQEQTAKRAGGSFLAGIAGAAALVPTGNLLGAWKAYLRGLTGAVVELNDAAEEVEQRAIFDQAMQDYRAGERALLDPPKPRVTPPKTNTGTPDPATSNTLFTDAQVAKARELESAVKAAVKANDPVAWARANQAMKTWEEQSTSNKLALDAVRATAERAATTAGQVTQAMVTKALPQAKKLLAELDAAQQSGSQARLEAANAAVFAFEQENKAGREAISQAKASEAARRDFLKQRAALTRQTLEQELEGVQELTGAQLAAFERVLEAKRVAALAEGDTDRAQVFADALRKLQDVKADNLRAFRKELDSTSTSAGTLREQLANLVPKDALTTARDQALTPFNEVIKQAQRNVSDLEKAFAKLDPTQQAGQAGQVLKRALDEQNAIITQAQAQGRAAQAAAEQKFNQERNDRATDANRELAKRLFDDGSISEASYTRFLDEDRKYWQARLQNAERGSDAEAALQRKLLENDQERRRVQQEMDRRAADTRAFAREEVEAQLALASTDSERAAARTKLRTIDQNRLADINRELALIKGVPAEQERVRTLERERLTLQQNLNTARQEELRRVDDLIQSQIGLRQAQQEYAATVARTNDEVAAAKAQAVRNTQEEVRELDRQIATARQRALTQAQLNELLAQREQKRAQAYVAERDAAQYGIQVAQQQLDLDEARQRAQLELKGMADDAVASAQLDLSLTRERQAFVQGQLDRAASLLLTEEQQVNLKKELLGLLGTQAQQERAVTQALRDRQTLLQNLTTAQETLRREAAGRARGGVLTDATTQVADARRALAQAERGYATAFQDLQKAQSTGTLDRFKTATETLTSAIAAQRQAVANLASTYREQIASMDSVAEATQRLRGLVTGQQDKPFQNNDTELARFQALQRRRDQALATAQAALKSGDPKALAAAASELARQEERYRQQNARLERNGINIALQNERSVETLLQQLETLDITYDQQAVDLETRAAAADKESVAAVTFSDASARFHDSVNTLVASLDATTPAYAALATALDTTTPATPSVATPDVPRLSPADLQSAVSAALRGTLASSLLRDNPNSILKADRQQQNLNLGGLLVNHTHTYTVKVSVERRAGETDDALANRLAPLVVPRIEDIVRDRKRRGNGGCDA